MPPRRSADFTSGSRGRRILRGENGRIRHPDIFPPKKSRAARSDAEPRNVKVLLLVFGIPALVLLMAEITDVSIGEAGLLSLLVVVAGISFYELESHRRGWTVVTREGPYLQLRRGRERLIVFLSDDWRPETSVWYIFEETSGP